MIRYLVFSILRNCAARACAVFLQLSLDCAKAECYCDSARRAPLPYRPNVRMNRR